MELMSQNLWASSPSISVGQFQKSIPRCEGLPMHAWHAFVHGARAP
jgi:hypothetical protein